MPVKRRWFVRHKCLTVFLGSVVVFVLAVGGWCGWATWRGLDRMDRMYAIRDSLQIPEGWTQMSEVVEDYTLFNAGCGDFRCPQMTVGYDSDSPVRSVDQLEELLPGLDWSLEGRECLARENDFGWKYYCWMSGYVDGFRVSVSAGGNREDGEEPGYATRIAISIVIEEW
ncbi:MAG: hypothetical protein LBJ02_04915 [Bifidobacteriaceae bacterium]|nr:hypothetical protein [Bifidobacteriaceae bacterium]